MQTKYARPVPVQAITPTKKMQLLKFLRDFEFSGKIIWRNSSTIRWIAFYRAGHLMYATGEGAAKRWERSLKKHGIGHQVSARLLQPGFSVDRKLDLLDHQEYVRLGEYVNLGELTQAQAAEIIRSLLEEILLDLFLAKDVIFTVVEDDAITPIENPILVNETDIFQAVSGLWEKWGRLNINGCLPTLAPVIKQPEKIQEKTNRQLYEVLTALLDGRHTLWDLAAKMNRDVVQITQALNTFIQFGWIELQIPSDEPRSPQMVRAEVPALSQTKTDILVACVDDSPLICQSMEKIVTAQGYQFVSVLDPLRAISTLLSKKPDIIFLDLVMPYTNGYEICSRLRKASQFSTTPIIILSGNDGVVDQVRARLMGATDFVSKPVDSGIILSAIRQHLKSPALA